MNSRAARRFRRGLADRWPWVWAPGVTVNIVIAAGACSSETLRRWIAQGALR